MVLMKAVTNREAGIWQMGPSAVWALKIFNSELRKAGNGTGGATEARELKIKRK
jgi:hypothetical protein